MFLEKVKGKFRLQGGRAECRGKTDVFLAKHGWELGQKMHNYYLCLQHSAVHPSQYKSVDDVGSKTFLSMYNVWPTSAFSLKFKFASADYGQGMLNYEVGVSFLLFFHISDKVDAGSSNHKSRCLLFGASSSKIALVDGGLWHWWRLC